VEHGPKPTGKKSKSHSEKREAISDFSRFLRGARVAACSECGSTSNLQEATLSWSGTDDIWEITLPICKQCAVRFTH
jgi:hypothetical protein